jgi:DNA repair exonuclease SbcCD nuclease subunit
MKRALLQIKTLAKKHKAVVLCAGDLFDKAIVSPELINWALDNMPHVYGVAGQHDLPTHRSDQKHRSAWGTLVRAGKITELGEKPIGIDFLTLYGRPFDGKTPRRRPHHCDGLGMKHVLVTHEYIWKKDHGYTGAPDERRVRKLARRFKSFDVVHVGDNHKGFLHRLKNGTWILNTGTLLRRKSDEADYEPRVGLIWRSGNVTLHYLNTRRDVITPTDPVEERAEEDEEISEFIEELGRLEPSTLSFRETLLRVLDRKKVRKLVREKILEALE